MAYLTWTGLALLAALFFAQVSADYNKCPADCTCHIGQAYMDCRGINIQLPVPIPNDITVAVFTNCFLGETWPKMPDNYSNIESLTIKGGQFKAIESHAFEYLTEMHTLVLDNNRLESLDKDLFSDLPELRELEARGNKIASIEDDTFQDNPKLEILILNDNPGIQLSSRSFAQPEGVENKLRRVELRNCGLTEVPTSSICPSKVPALKELDLGGNDFRNLTEGLFEHAPGLQYLNLDSCGIPEIKSKTLGSLEQLETLYLSHNNITAIDDQAFDAFFSTAKFLHLEYNQMTKVSYTLFNFQQLHVLNVSYNPWECSCANRWLQTFPVEPNNTNFVISCATPEKYNGENALAVMTQQVEDCGPETAASGADPMIALYVAIPIVIVLTIVTIIIVVKICRLKKRERGGSTQYSLVYKPTTEKA